jgi:DNA-binding NarL/FixJ family response regulator
MTVSVVICDDDLQIRDMWADWLELLRDIDVVGRAASGEEAISFILEKQPTFAMVDRSMPPGDGITAIRAVRAGGYRGPIVVVSGEDGEGADESDLTDVHYVSKASGPSALATFLDGMGW